MLCLDFLPPWLLRAAIPLVDFTAPTSAARAYFATMRASTADKSPLQAGLELLVAGGSARADHGMDVRNRRGTKREAARTDEVLQVLLTCNPHRCRSRSG